MGRVRTPEQEARIAAAQVDFEAIKPYLALFKEAILDASKEAEADAMFANFTDAQKNMARMVVLQKTANKMFAF